jgi:nucleoside 2-deoxyribosyltransferase
MKVYVASKWENKPRVKEIMTILREHGHTITYDWTECEVSNVEQAILDLRGVADADILVGVFEKDTAYKGSLVELGAALALGKPVYILGDAPVIYDCIFFRHPHVRRVNDIWEVISEKGWE